MDNILTKKIQTLMSNYFSTTNQMTKPELRCFRDMVLGVLKSKSVFVNQIAASLREGLKLKDVAKRLSAHYLKDDYADKVLANHLDTVCCSVSKTDFIIMDGTDISKKYAKYMEGLEFVKNGDTGAIGLGYNVLNINAIGSNKEMTPLFSKAYSYEMGALSSNKEIKKAVCQVNEYLPKQSCWVFDRGADNTILKEFFITECAQCIIRLKRNTKLFYQADPHRVDALAKKVDFCISQKVTKIKKDRPVSQVYELGAIPVSYRIKGQVYPLWLVVSRGEKGQLCYLLVKRERTSAIEVAKWVFKGYGLRWKIEEYHRHIKQEYCLEDIQIKTFYGLQSMLAILTVAMYMIYNKIQSVHYKLLLDSGYNYLNKHTLRELTNFIYYKISKVVSILLMPTKSRWKIIKTQKPLSQMSLEFN